MNMMGFEAGPRRGLSPLRRRVSQTRQLLLLTFVALIAGCITGGHALPVCRAAPAVDVTGIEPQAAFAAPAADQFFTDQWASVGTYLWAVTNDSPETVKPGAQLWNTRISEGASWSRQQIDGSTHKASMKLAAGRVLAVALHDPPSDRIAVIGTDANGRPQVLANENVNDLAIGTPFTRAIGVDGSSVLASNVGVTGGMLVRMEEPDYAFSANNDALGASNPFAPTSRGFAAGVSYLRINVSGDHLVVAAAGFRPRATEPGSIASGAIFVFSRNGTAWSDPMVIMPTAVDERIPVSFARAIAVSTDKLATSSAFTLAPNASSKEGVSPGYVMIYSVVDGSPLSTLQSPAGVIDGFGSSIAFYGDILAVAAPGPGILGECRQTEPGRVYLYDTAQDGSPLVGELLGSGPDFGENVGGTGLGLVVTSNHGRAAALYQPR